MATLSSIVGSAVNTVNGPKGDKGDKGDTGLSLNNIPSAGTQKTTNYVLSTDDVGDHVTVASGGSITIPDATFTAGDVVTIFNNNASTITITCSITTAYIAGLNVNQSSVTLDSRGIASVLFISGTVCVISGNVS